MKATLVKENISFPKNLTNVDGTLYFTAYYGGENELWKSDGTANGTVLVKDIDIPGSSSSYSSEPSNLTNVNGTLYFTAIDSIYGEELWRSDGTENGTVLVKDIRTGYHSFPKNLTNVNGTLYFTANDGTNGEELWKSDGTENGTVLVKDIKTGFRASSSPWEIRNIGDTLYFGADDGIHGNELWKSDGTENGTVLVKDIGKNIGTDYNSYGAISNIGTNVNGTLYFTANDGKTTNGSGAELWRSDGTENGTILVKDIRTGWGSSTPDKLTNVNGTLYFTANGLANGLTNGRELWKSDGTENGTILVKDIISGRSSSDPNNLTNVNGTLYFTANEGNGELIYNRELWKSDGTAEGTVLVKNINSGINSSDPLYLTNVNGTLYFTANDGTNGRELWKSDGTAEGTVLVQDINSVGSSNPLDLTNINGTLYFTADDGTNGRKLWKLSENSSPVNESPTELLIDNESINENKPDGSLVGNFSTTDPDVDDTFTYSLVIGTGNTDNSAFTIVDNQLKINNSPDYETKSSYNIRVRTTDNGGLFYEKQLTINVNDLNDATEGPDSILGTNGADTIDGLAGDDTIKSLDGDDQLFGSDGKDYLDGGKGNDSMQGGMGDDTYFVDSINDKVTENLNSGNDIVFSTVSYTIPNNVERLSLFGSQPDKIATGGGSADYLIGSAVADKLIGNAGDDTMKGNGGIDTMIGGKGNDFYLVDQTGDVIEELADGGNNDQVYSSVSYTMPANAEKLYLIGTTAGRIAIGQGKNDYLIGSSAADKFKGNDGDDTIKGNEGNDTMKGSDGNDLYIVDQTGDVIEELSDEGNNDQIYSSVSYTAPANVEKLYLVGTTAGRTLTGRGRKDYLIGSSVADKLLGKGNADILIGGDGNDEMTGGAGNDILQGGEGADHFIYNTDKVFVTSAIGVDAITDFTKSESDKIVLDKTTFKAISSIAGQGFSVKEEFASLTSKFDTSEANIVYNSGTGKLFYNQNGIEAGYGTGGHFITLSNKPALSASDFIIQA